MKRIILFLMIAIVTSISTIKVFADTPTKPTDLSDAQIIKLCNWYISTPPSDDPEQNEMCEAVKLVIVEYSIDTKKFAMEIWTPVTTILDVSGNHDEMNDLLIVYMAGEIIYCLEHNLTKSNADSFASAIEGVLFQYSLMPKHPLKELNKFIKMDKDKRHSELVKFYNKMEDK